MTSVNIPTPLISLFGGALGGIGARKLGLTDMLAIFRGEKVAPDWLLELVSLLNKGIANPKLAPMILTFVKDQAAAKGLDESKLDAWLTNLAKASEIPLTAQSLDEKVAQTLGYLDDSLVSESEHTELTALVVCPKCDYRHFI